LLAPAKPQIQPNDAGSGAVHKPRHRDLSITKDHLTDVAVTVALRPFKRRLQLEALTLALLIVGGDSFGSARRDTFDT
jgi:hypothetical protein